jgi:hypothetical protein
MRSLQTKEIQGMSEKLNIIYIADVTSVTGPNHAHVVKQITPSVSLGSEKGSMTDRILRGERALKSLIHG